MAERGGGRRKGRGPGQFSRKVAERVAVKDQGIGPLLTRRCLLQEEMYKNQMCCEVLLIDRRGLCGCVALAEIITEAIEIVAASARGAYIECACPNPPKNQTTLEAVGVDEAVVVDETCPFGGPRGPFEGPQGLIERP